MNSRFVVQFLTLLVVLALCVAPLAAQTRSIPPAPLPPLHDISFDGLAEAVENAADEGAKDAAEEDAEEEEDDLDFLDKDLSEIRNTTAKAATALDPEITGVSKKAESLSEAPGIVDVISAKDIEEFGAKNLYEVLQWATSVYMTGSYLFPGNNASIRGDRFTHYDNHTLTLINGRPFRDSTLGGMSKALYQAFPVDTIHHVEIMRGPGSVLYGTNGYSGVINIVTKNPNDPTMKMSAMAGTDDWQQYRMSGGAGTEDEGLYIGADYNRTRGWPFSVTDELSNTSSTLQGQDNLGVFAMYRNGGLTANFFVADIAYEAMGVLPMWPSDVVDSTRAFGDLGYFLEIGEYQSVDLHATYNFDQTIWDFPPIPPSNNNNVSHGYLLEGTYRAELTDRMNVMIGGFADIHQGGVEISGVIPNYSETWYGVYLQADYKPTDWLKLVGGVQGNLPGAIPGGAVPRAGFIITPHENWTAKLLYGQAFRSPYVVERTFADLPIIQGNPDLIPETIQTFDLQLAYHTDTFRFATTYYHSDYFELINRVGAGPITYANNGTMEFQGLEFENEWKICDHLRWQGSVSYQDNVTDTGLHNSTHVPAWMAKMGISYQTNNGWSLGLFDSYFGAPSPVTDVNPGASVVNPVPAAYHLVSLNLTCDLEKFLRTGRNRSTKVQLLVDNLFDEDIDQPEFSRRNINSIPGGPGRTVYGAVTMEY